MLVIAVVATIGLTGIVDWFVMSGQSSTCGDRPDPGEVRTDRIALAAIGPVAVLPAFVLLVNGLRAGAWVGSFCF